MSFAAIAAPIAGAVVGGMMGGDGGGGSQTASKTPWEPAIKPLTNSLNTGQDLERYYQQTPFNIIQQQGYQNLFSDLDQFRNQMQPGLMNFANQMMTSNYQRGPRNSQMEAMQSAPQGMQMGSTRPQMMQQGPDGAYTPQGGLLAAQANGNGMQGGLLGQGVFQAPAQGNYGRIDFNQLNPFTADNGIPQAPVEKPVDKTPEELAREEWERLMRTGEAYRGAGA